MKTTRREFIQTSAFATLAATQPLNAAAAAPPERKSLDGFDLAHAHSIVRDLPTPNFFEGMLLGDGDVGVCVVVRPDALGLHVGKNDCWDIRLSEDVEEQVLPSSELLKLWQRAGDEAKRQGKPDMLFLESSIDFFHEYTHKTEASYLRPWPRPWPCGSVWVHWDPRWVQPALHSLDPANGSFTLDLKCVNPVGGSRNAKLTVFVDWTTGLISASTDTPVSVQSIRYYPRIDQAQGSNADSKIKLSALPHPELSVQAGPAFAEFSCFQYFPALGPTEKMPAPPKSDKDRNFALHARIAGTWAVETGDKENSASLNATSEQALRLDIKLATPREILLERLEREAASSGDRHPWILIPQDHVFSEQDLDTRTYARKEVERLVEIPSNQIQRDSEARWREFWSRSAVQLDDKELERIWYHNQYFLACCLRQGKTAPGLFANWSTDDIGTSWHGDYHMDYNCEQAFWGVFSSNHAEQHLPYVELCQNLLAMSEKFAHDKFDLPGACFPLTAVPVPSQSMFIPSPPWVYLISNTPWTVQSLWWQYLYTQDVDYLRRVYPILQAAAQFLAAYVKKGDDGKYHFIPTVSPENWGLTVDFRLNKDCIIDLALTQFLLDAVIEGSTVLETDAADRPHWKDIRENLAPYPKGKGPYGEVWLDVVDAPEEHVYNLPITLAPVFPGEQVGIGRDTEYQMELARRTAKFRFDWKVRTIWLRNLWSEPASQCSTLTGSNARFVIAASQRVANDRVRQVVGPL